jgi:hypothetical protein
LKHNLARDIGTEGVVSLAFDLGEDGVANLYFEDGATIITNASFLLKCIVVAQGDYRQLVARLQ